MSFAIKTDINAFRMLSTAGLDPQGDAQRFFTGEIMRASDPYTPFDTGVLKNTAQNLGDSIYYNTPYARYMWYGKLMVDPITHKGAFFNENYGFWSRPNTPKVLTDTDLVYHGGGKRGSYWVNRAWIDNKDTIIKSTENYIKMRCGK